MAVEIWIPESARGRVLRCTVSGCDHEYPESQRDQWQRHVIAHIKRDDTAIQAHALERVTNPILAGQDREAIEWVRRRQAETGKPAARGGRPI